MWRIAIVWMVLAGAVHPAQGADDSGFISAEFLFQSGDTAYIHCDQAIGIHDSVAAEGFGEALDVGPPLWLIRIRSGYVAPEMGTAIRFRHIERPRAAARLDLICASDPWDPLQLSGVSGWIVGGLIHRTLFNLDVTSPPGSAIATSYSWRARDLIVVLDTSLRLGDGTPVSAFAVKASLERYLWYRRNTAVFGWDRTIAGVDSYREGRVGHVVGLIPRSADTLQFNLVRPCYALPGRLSALATAIVGWTVSGNESPVTAAAGYYGARDGAVLKGTSDHGGELVLTLDPASDGMMLGDAGESAAGMRGVLMPELLIVRAGVGAAPELLTFLNYALDRTAVASIACGSRARFPSGLLPEAIVPAGGGEVNMEEAVAARALLPGKPVVRVAAGAGYEEVAEYLVAALKAWEFEVVYAAPGGAYDLRVEHWKFGSFDPDELAEGVMHRLGFVESDTLVARLWAARSMQDTAPRLAAYRSLTARLADRAPYVVIYQRSSDFVFDRTRYEAVVNRWGRPVGPIFDRDGER